MRTMTSFSLRDICYEPIAPGFSYGMFGDFKIIVDTNTGFFNATKLCAAGGKNFKNWIRNKRTKDLLEYLKRRYDEPLLYLQKGKSGPMNATLRGVYVSRRLLTCVACWLSPAIADRVNEIANDYFENQFREKCARDEIRILERPPEGENGTGEHEGAGREASEPGKIPLLVLVETNGVYPYYAIRCQKKSKSSQMSKLRQKYPDLREVFEIAYDPSAMNIFRKIKENIKDVTMFCNGIKLLNGYTIEDFERDLRKIAEEN